MKKGLIILILLLLVIKLSMAAEIKGTVYGPDLNPIENVVVKINTQPAQTFLAKDSTYTFNVPKGDYLIEASYTGENSEKYYFSEKIEVNDEGEYIIDIIMFPSTGEEIEPYPENDLSIGEPDIIQNGGLFNYIIGIILVVFIIFAIVFFMRKKNKNIMPETEKDEYFETIFDFIKKEKRATQRDIIKQVPLSEAKISLILSDMESQGIIRKFKKGRTNIIIWNK